MTGLLDLDSDGNVKIAEKKAEKILTCLHEKECEFLCVDSLEISAFDDTNVLQTLFIGSVATPTLQRKICVTADKPVLDIESCPLDRWWRYRSDYDGKQD